MGLRELADGTVQNTKTGALHGSVGKGKGKTPKPAPPGPESMLAAHGPATPAGAMQAEEAMAAWRKKRVPQGYPQWAQEVQFRDFAPETVTHWDVDYVLSMQTERDSLPRVGEERSTDCARDTFRGGLRAELIDGSQWTDEHRQRNSYYRIMGVGPDTDGSRPVFLYSHDDRKVVQRISWGMLSPDGKFTMPARGDATFSSMIAGESVLREHAGGEIDDITYTPRTNANGEPAALEFRAVSEWYDDSGFWD